MFLRSSPRFSLALACLMTLAIAPFLPACKAGSDSAEPPAPWVHTSEEARYQITIPPTWSRETDPKTLNAFADFGTNLDNSLFLIVIPQKLPTFPVPDARAVKSAGMEMMQKNVADMQLNRQGDIVLDTVNGVSTFFEATVQTERIQYIATYITHAGWGYQIIAWGSRTAERRLIEEVDQILAGWKFLDRENLIVAPDSQPSMDAAPSASDPHKHQILNSLDNVIEHPESEDSILGDSDQDDEEYEVHNDSNNIDLLSDDDFSEGN